MQWWEPKMRLPGARIHTYMTLQAYYWAYFMLLEPPQP